MAKFTATITLDDGTVLGSWTTNPDDTDIRTMIEQVAPTLGYQARIFDNNGSLVDNPESACTYMLRTQRSLEVVSYNQKIAELAAAAALQEALSRPVTF